MKNRTLLIVALALNVILAIALIWMWRTRQSAEPAAQNHAEHPPMEGFTPAPVQDSNPPLNPVQLTPERMQSIGVRTGKAEYASIATEIRATGTIDVDERRIAYVQTRYPGWIRNVFVNATYQYVRRGEPLFTIYSQELAASEQEYALAKRNAAKLRQSSLPDVAAGAEQLVESARERLKQWNISDAEIEKLDATDKPQSEFTFASPVSGYVLDRMALPNAYVQPEMRLYTVADLSNVWAYGQVFQEDAGRLKPGDRAELTVDTYPGRTFSARVEQLLPQVDPTTRTLRVRMSVPNPGLLLKPGMFVNIQFQGQATRQLVVPATAVLKSGNRDVAFIDRGNGMFEPREVSIALRSGDRVAIRSGLNAGDVVVTSASFLIDSESQLQAAAGAFVPAETGAGSAVAPAETAKAELTTNPSPPKKGRNEVRVRLTDATGRPLPNAKVNVRFFMPGMPAMGMAEMKVTADLQDRGDGLYSGGIELDSGGTWQVTITVQQNGKTIVTKRLSLTATGGM
jgi:RND family efflux transporter MFP subunit